MGTSGILDVEATLESLEALSASIVDVLSVGDEPLQLLFPHGSWSMRRDKSSWVMVHTSPYNALYDP